jgi:hypothetical protein
MRPSGDLRLCRIIYAIGRLTSYASLPNPVRAVSIVRRTVARPYPCPTTSFFPTDSLVQP